MALAEMQELLEAEAAALAEAARDREPSGLPEAEAALLLVMALEVGMALLESVSLGRPEAELLPEASSEGAALSEPE